MEESYDEFLGSQHSCLTTFWAAQAAKPKIEEPYPFIKEYSGEELEDLEMEEQ